MRLFVGPNVIFVGTMNEDETTQALSDKVIDRSNVLRFGSPSSLEPVNSNGKLAPAVSRTLLYEDWKKSWLRDESVFEAVLCGLPNRSIATLREAMDSVNRPFAYRVAKGILEYAANYPAADDHMHEVISDQIEQKILPRLRGVDPTERQGSLAFKKIRSVVRECKDELLENHLQRLTQDNYFQWIGLDRAREVTNG